jgi:hypothetical protein
VDWGIRVLSWLTEDGQRPIGAVQALGPVSRDVQAVAQGEERRFRARELLGAVGHRLPFLLGLRRVLSCSGGQVPVVCRCLAIVKLLPKIRHPRHEEQREKDRRQRQEHGTPKRDKERRLHAGTAAITLDAFG